jgi:uncharacterized membrane protein
MSPVSRVSERRALLALFGFTVVALAGYWNFALHPERIPASGFGMRVYAYSFPWFARLHVLAAAGTLMVLLVGRLRARWVPAALAVSGFAFLFEHIGTGYGVPFGGYGYTDLLGFKLGGRVPVLIPLSWFLMALPSWAIAHAAIPRRALRIAVGALWLVAWDLALDPAMSYLTPYWRWEATGPYYGMPWVNLLGWYLTGLTIMSVLEAIGGRIGLSRLPVGWLAGYYGVVLLMPLGMVAAAGLGGAVATTFAALGLCVAVTWAAGRADVRAPSDARPRRRSAASESPTLTGARSP